MSKTVWFRLLVVIMVFAFVASACAGQPAPAPTAAPAPAAPAAPAAPTATAALTATTAPASTAAAPAAPVTATVAPAAGAALPVPSVDNILTPVPAGTFKVTGKFYWVQNTAWHPVHQLTQQSFLQGCADNGLQCELATTDETSTDSFLALADQVVSRPDNKGMAMWAGGLPAVAPIIEKAKAKGIPVVLPHFPVPQGSFADNAVQIAADSSKWPDPVAKAMCDQLKGQKGSVAVTENNHNATEDMVATVFTKSMKQYCPDLNVLPVQLEGADPTQAIAVGVSIMQANPDIVAALSTTGGGPTTWAGAQKETGKKIVAVGMDYTRVNLDLVKAGQVWGIVAQPLYNENWGAAKLLGMLANRMTVPYNTVLSAPLVTLANVNDYYGILDRFEPKFRATAPAPTATP